MSAAHPAVARLEAAIGRENVLSADADRVFYGMDAFRGGEIPCAVARPTSTDDVRKIVWIAAEMGLTVAPRGGGASYTDAFVPRVPDAILVDTSRMNRIIEINEQDMYVTAEAGVTWAELEAALKPRGLRPPFFGPFSGIAATLGGSLSQNAVSWGTGIFGVSADSVLGLEVVLGNGEVLRTGSWAGANALPFFRHYGPDLTGLFTGDAGAFGIKTRVSLRLIRRPTEFLALSFKFATFDGMVRGMGEAARDGNHTINFGLDPALQQGQIGKTDTGEAIKAARAVFASSRGILDGVSQLLRMAVAGRRFLSGDVYSVHYIVEGVDRAAVRSAAGRLRDVIAPHGIEVANTIPMVVHAMPFAPLYNVLGPRGERWLPLHGILPFSRVAGFREDLNALYGRYADRMQQHKVTRGAMFMTIATNAFLYEPVFYWQDDRTAYHERMVPKDYLATLPKYPANPAARELVAEMKAAILELFHRHGAAHLQIGKMYPLLRDRETATVELLRSVKAKLDPHRRMNPGALGL